MHSFNVADYLYLCEISEAGLQKRLNKAFSKRDP